MAHSPNSRAIALLREQKGMAAIYMAMLGTILVGITALAVDVCALNRGRPMASLFLWGNPSGEPIRVSLKRGDDGNIC